MVVWVHRLIDKWVGKWLGVQLDNLMAIWLDSIWMVE